MAEANETSPSAPAAPAGPAPAAAPGADAVRQAEVKQPQPPPRGTRQGGGGTEPMVFWLVAILFMFAVMYFLVIRPQHKKERERKELLNNVHVNDHIVTIGGIHGVVTAVKVHELIVRVDEKTKIRFTRSAVARIVTEKEDIGPEIEA
jgi:preprotein translocase subunit YajC